MFSFLKFMRPERLFDNFPRRKRRNKYDRPKPWAGKDFSTLSRQRVRRQLFKDDFAALRRQYGGESRRALRAIARDRSHRAWANRNAAQIAA